MIHRYQTNLRCAGCVATLRSHLDGLAGLKSWSAETDSPEKVLTVEGDESVLKQVPARVKEAGYSILKELPSSLSLAMAPESLPITTVIPTLKQPDAKTYFPLILILFYLLLATAAFEIAAGQFAAERAMRHFMAGFFLVFSFFKLLNLSAFADAYSGYDVIAKRWHGYGYFYPFIELGLGFAYLAQGPMLAVNLTTAIVMAVSLVGVLQTVLAKRQIRCACLGTVFNLPMSYVTIVEDSLMLAMALAMFAVG